MFLKSSIKQAALMLLALACCSAPAQALDMMVWDKALQTKLAYGQTEQTASSKVLSGQVLRGASGPVVVLFSLDEAEKARRAFGTLESRYEGELKDGKLLLKLPGGVQSLEKLLEGYGFKLDLKPTKPADAKPTSVAVPVFGPENVSSLDTGLTAYLNIYRGAK